MTAMNIPIIRYVCMLLLPTFTNGFSFSKTHNSNMVLQRDVPATVWGLADTIGEQVQVTFDQNVYTTTAFEENGAILWAVQLDSRPAGGPYDIEAAGETETVTITNVLFGDVWFCSGQSNMVHAMYSLDDPEPDLEDAVNWPNVRIFHAGLNFSYVPLVDVVEPTATWTLPNYDTVYQFSAICFLFGRHLNQELGIPIGLIHSSWGGTAIEVWSSPEALAQCNRNNEGAENLRKPEGFDDPFPVDGSVLYNSMVYPHLRQTIKGAIWYQGESNSGNSGIYACQLASMITDWRTKWNQASGASNSFPFGVVQLSGWREDDSLTEGFPDIRWAQTANYGYTPNEVLQDVFLAVSMDLPDPDSPWGSIHPRYKRPIAERLFLGALPLAYSITTRGRYQGPFPTNIEPSADSLLIQFDNLNSVLEIRALAGFEVCCAVDSNIKCTDWSVSEVLSEQSGVVRVSVDCQGQMPLGVRYCWRETPCALDACPVYSVENQLPAPPFIFMF